MTQAGTALSHLTNPLATSVQLRRSASAQDGLGPDLESSIRYASSLLVQRTGILLYLPQDLIARAIVLFHRSIVGLDGLSLCKHNAQDIAAACLYLVLKTSDHARPARHVLTAINTATKTLLGQPPPQAEALYMSPAEQRRLELTLYGTEAQVLRAIGYQTHVSLPYTLCIIYLQTLGLLTTSTDGHGLAQIAVRRINDMLISPQMVFLKHQPGEIAAAAIYAAAQESETGTKLPDLGWWEIFEVRSEKLAELVVQLREFSARAREEGPSGLDCRAPLTVEGIVATLAQLPKSTDPL